MNATQLDKRRLVMKRSMALGHCICDPRQPCPCDALKARNVCHCAGETVPPSHQSVRLTEHVRSPGCASKIPKRYLHDLLHDLPALDDPRVLVGSAAGDDAGVILLSPDTASILTVDVFTPIVDDPYTFGQIAAANSLSDIYAMGGTPQAALSIVGFPVDALPLDALREILRGGAATMNAAGVPVIGGHSINDAEPKCGFAVLGTCPANGFVRNAGARVGDAIVLTKPLGTGILAFARQLDRIDEGDFEPAARSMATLNRLAAQAMVRHGVHAATDVTGFSLLGHMSEIVRHSGTSGIEVEIDFDALPLFPNVARLAAADVLPGAVERNRESVDPRLLDASDLTPAECGILFGPETSGGILAFLPPAAASAFLGELVDQDAARIIGRVTGEHPGGRIHIVRNRTSQPDLPSRSVLPEVSPGPEKIAAGACCSNGHSSPAEGGGEKPAANNTPAGLPAAAHGEALRTYLAAVNAPGALDGKSKKLIALALSIVAKCEPCVKINLRAAREAGASDSQIAEAAAMAIAFGGAPAAMFYQSIRQS